jgi:predicted porin
LAARHTRVFETTIASPVYSGYASAHTRQVIVPGGSSTFGSATVGATYSNIQFKNLGNTVSYDPNPLGYQGNAKLSNAEANFKYQFTPALLVGATFEYTKGDSISTAAGSTSGVTYYQGVQDIDYFLSKRTDVYLIGV